MTNVYGPLNKDYCVWFYFLSILGFVMLVLTIVASLYIGIVRKKGPEYFVGMLAVSLSYGIFYFQNRLLWSMCSKTL
jgi:hypothetical protein